MLEAQAVCLQKSIPAIPERTVIRRILAGETELYGIFAARYSRRVYNFVRRMVKNDMDAEDVVQEAHLRALKYLHQFRGRCKFITWLSHVAANVAYRQMQQQYRLEKVFDNLDPRIGRRRLVLVSSTPDPESCVRDRESREILRRALAKLPRHYRLIFVMKEVRHVATPEIARCLRIKHNNVRLQLHRARRMLRRTIDNDYQ